MNKLFAAAFLALAACAAATSSLAAAEKSAAAPGPQITGKVVETMNASTYTYVRLETDAGQVWAAAPQFAVKRGDTVALAGAMPMPNYESKTLHRTFDLVYFTGQVTVNGAPATGTISELPKDHPPIPAESKAKRLDLSGIKRAENGQTVAEIIADGKQFAGKIVTVRARVVKSNPNILDRNWLHVRDGSGSEGANDLTVTTKDTAKVGDLVLVTGKLAANRDFGAGYSYELIVEDATIAPQ